MTRFQLVGFVLLASSVAACGPDGAVPTSNVDGVPGGLASRSDTAVTTVIADSDLSVASALQIQSDAFGPYQNSRTLTSVIQNIGAWVLDSYNPRNSTRRVYLGFTQPIAGSGPNGGDPIAVKSYPYKVHMIAKCNLYGNNMLTLTPGATIPCPLHIAFDYNGSAYAVQMNPSTSSADTAYTETNYANITCVVPASGSGPCTQWRIAPSGTSPFGAANVAKLLKYVTTAGKTVGVDQGDFYFSFAMTVTRS